MVAGFPRRGGRKTVLPVNSKWWSAHTQDSSAAWRMFHWEEAARSGELALSGNEIEVALQEGWPEDAAGLARAAAWVSEAVWPRGSAGLSLSLEEVRRARQIGTALLGPAPLEGVACSVWEVAAFFTSRERVLIRLQLPPESHSSPATCERSTSIPVAKMQRLIAFARAAVQESPGAAHG
jgi:hypothetical protein